MRTHRAFRRRLPVSRRAATLALLVVCLAPTPGTAQQQDSAATPARPPGGGVVVALTGGLGSLDFAGSASLTVYNPRFDIILRTAGSAEFEIFGPPNSVSDVAALIGTVVHAGRGGWIRIAGGPAATRGDRVADAADCNFFGCSYEMESDWSPGIAGQLDAVWTPFDHLGVGLTGFVGAGGSGSFGGLTVGIQLGRVRR